MRTCPPPFIKIPIVADMTMARREYIALVASFFLIFLEALVRIITLGLRNSTLPHPLPESSNVSQLGPLCNGSTIGPRVPSTSSPLLRVGSQERGTSQSLHPSLRPRILSICAPCSAITPRNTLFRPLMATSWVSTAWVGERERKTDK